MVEKSLEERLAAVEDRLAIIDVLNKYAISIDRRRWDDFASCFTDEVELNVIRTGKWVRWSRADLMTKLTSVFESYTATQHLSANHQIAVKGDEAIAWATLHATHYLRDMPGGDLQQQIGYYEYTLVRNGIWQISRYRQVEHWQDGNQEIFDRTL